MEKTACKSVFRLILMLLMFQLATATAPIAKSGCPGRCGDISIPYPFGTREGCYTNEWFAIECNETSNHPRAFIRSIDMELVNISVGEGAVVKAPVISVDSSGRQAGGPVDLRGTPFMFSGDNYFVAVGCNTRAKFYIGQGSEHMGCDSICLNGSSNVFNWRETYASSRTGNGGCGEIPIPSKLQHFNLSFQPIGDKRRIEGLNQAFLADYSWFDEINLTTVEMKNLTSVPLSLLWMVPQGGWKYDEVTMTCYDEPTNGTNFTTSSHGCRCSDGYEGNPFLQCTDFDECEDGKFCHRWTRCVNTKGSYKCELDALRISILVIAAVVGVLLLLAGIWLLYRFIKKRREVELRKKFFKRNGGLLLQQQLSSSEGSIQNTKIYSSKELEAATDRFNENRILGQGGQGTVYKGMLTDGRIVAVKKSTLLDEEKLEEFINEVVILSQINHRNVVKLLGCCLETEVPLLVYEFIPNGNLFRYIHDQNEEFILSWEVRLRIAIEISGALSYLHSAASIPIYHRDIKSTNILLDENYRAKVSDFGSSRSIAIDQTHLTTHVQGTFGYLDPEYFQSSQFTEKSDVYSFGVVLVELLSGQKPIFSASPTETRSLATHFILLMEDNRLFEILDARVKEHSQNEEVVAVANLAKTCLNLNGKKRPTMKYVATELERIVGLSQKGTNVQQDSQKTGNLMADQASNAWDAVPTSINITCDFDNGMAAIAPSSDVDPLITYKTW